MQSAFEAALEHEIAAEHHAALAAMYRERAARLQARLAESTKEVQAAFPEQGSRVEHFPGRARTALS